MDEHAFPPTGFAVACVGHTLQVYIQDICFFEVNTKYISLSELKTSEFSRVRSTSENIDVFNPEDEIYFMGKPTICIGENNDVDHREADQRLCFHYSDSTIPLLLKSDISNF